jgi:hypothetical protein
MSRLAWDHGIKALANAITCVIIAGGNDEGMRDDRKYSNNLTAGVF